MKNYLGQAALLPLLVAALLALLSLAPGGGRIGSFALRKMDIFSDLRSVEEAAKPPAEPEIASAELPAGEETEAGTKAVSAPDSTRYGQFIEDYSSDQRGLAAFYAAIDSIRTHGRRVRVAFYGDSFVEGDIVLGDLRDTLQELWGGNGVGFVPITSEVALSVSPG